MYLVHTVILCSQWNYKRELPDNIPNIAYYVVTLNGDILPEEGDSLDSYPLLNKDN